MKELTMNEVDTVSGGNAYYPVVAASWTAGTQIGTWIYSNYSTEILDVIEDVLN